MIKYILYYIVILVKESWLVLMGCKICNIYRIFFYRFDNEWWIEVFYFDDVISWDIENSEG